MSCELKIKDYLRREYSAEIGDSELDQDTPLLSSKGGFLDSLGVQLLLAYMEDDLGVELPDEDISPETFQTVGTLSAVFAKRYAQQLSH